MDQERGNKINQILASQDQATMISKILAFVLMHFKATSVQMSLEELEAYLDQIMQSSQAIAYRNDGEQLIVMLATPEQQQKIVEDHLHQIALLQLEKMREAMRKHNQN